MSKRILVIEDTENNRRILSDLLTNAGFEVLEAVDGEKGVAMAAALEIPAASSAIRSIAKLCASSLPI
jgi:CheY-like chemotaxis protein